MKTNIMKRSTHIKKTGNTPHFLLAVHFPGAAVKEVFAPERFRHAQSEKNCIHGIHDNFYLHCTSKNSVQCFHFRKLYFQETSDLGNNYPNKESKSNQIRTSPSSEISPIHPAKQASKYCNPLSPHTGLNSVLLQPQLMLQSFVST